MLNNHLGCPHLLLEILAQVPAGYSISYPTSCSCTWDTHSGTGALALITQLGESRWSFCLLVLAWPSSGYCGLLRSDTVYERVDYFSLSLIQIVSLKNHRSLRSLKLRLPMCSGDY